MRSDLYYKLKSLLIDIGGKGGIMNTQVFNQ